MYQMKKLFANFKDYKVAVLVTLCLLVGQAYCDMTMPQLTSEIIDTGIQNRGIEHILPSKMPDHYPPVHMVFLIFPMYRRISALTAFFRLPVLSFLFH